MPGHEKLDATLGSILPGFPRCALPTPGYKIGRMQPLPTALAGPVEVELAKLEETIPAERRMAGGSVYELKFDGYRLVIVRADQGVRL